MAKIIDLDIVLPLIVEQVQPNTVDVGTPVVTNIGSTSFDIEQTFSSGVDYYGGIYVGESADNNDDATLVKNPGYLNKKITGLTSGTTYYLNGVGIPILGNITVGKQISVTTGSSPIPDDYQLVEYLESTGTQYIPFYYAGVGEIGVDIDCALNANAIGNSVLFGRVNPNAPAIFFYQNAIYFTYKTGIGILGYDAIAFDTNFHNAKINYKANRSTIVDDNILYNITDNITTNSPLGLFCRYYQGAFNTFQNGKIARAFISLNNDDIAKMYPVYRKSDNKPGMYDIVNNVFYTNQGSGEFIVGPDKEWDE